jgi:hypothetical protein
MSYWALVGVESSVAWPKVDTEVEFRGHRLILRPATADRYASIAFQYPSSLTLDDAILVIRHYLSSLSWVEQAGIREVQAAGGSAPFFLGRGQQGSIVTDQFRHDYLPGPTDKRARLALAFYREGMSAESPAYRFLNFFKIINILHARGSEQVKWINESLSQVSDARANERITQLNSLVTDLGEYLYESGRCAIAHAFSDPLVNPEALADSRRLAEDLPVVQALAEVLIEREFAIKSAHTVWREHLYHLDGFRALLGPNLIARLKAREEVGAASIPVIPPISVGVRDKPQLPTFKHLQTEVVGVESGTIWLRCTAPETIAQIMLGLAIADERLVFDPEDHIAVSDAKTPAAMYAQRDQVILLRDLLLNGQFEIRDAGTGSRLGRTDAYMATNIDLRATIENLERIIKTLDEEIVQGEGASR